MGYATEFRGELIFVSDVSNRCLSKIRSFFGEDVRRHPEWEIAEGSYIDLRFNEALTGIEWDDETEKNDGMISHINLILSEVIKEFPEFGLTGLMIAQGEDPDDRWTIKVENNTAIRTEIKIAGESVTCPHCSRKFVINAFE